MSVFRYYVHVIQNKVLTGRTPLLGHAKPWIDQGWQEPCPKRMASALLSDPR